jgi:hypothetical protein
MFSILDILLHQFLVDTVIICFEFIIYYPYPARLFISVHQGDVNPCHSRARSVPLSFPGAKRTPVIPGREANRESMGLIVTGFSGSAACCGPKNDNGTGSAGSARASFLLEINIRGEFLAFVLEIKHIGDITGIVYPQFRFIVRKQGNAAGMTQNRTVPDCGTVPDCVPDCQAVSFFFMNVFTSTDIEAAAS